MGKTILQYRLEYSPGLSVMIESDVPFSRLFNSALMCRTLSTIDVEVGGNLGARQPFNKP